MAPEAGVSAQSGHTSEGGSKQYPKALTEQHGEGLPSLPMAPLPPFQRETQVQRGQVAPKTMSFQVTSPPDTPLPHGQLGPQGHLPCRFIARLRCEVVVL